MLLELPRVSDTRQPQQQKQQKQQQEQLLLLPLLLQHKHQKQEEEEERENEPEKEFHYLRLPVVGLRCRLFRCRRRRLNGAHIADRGRGRRRGEGGLDELVLAVELLKRGCSN